MNKSVLEMPKGCVSVKGEEMLLIDGGANWSISVTPSLATKVGATAAATKLCKDGKISWYNVPVVAQEIRGHAVAYYGTSALSSLGIAKSTMDELKSHANPIDGVDGPDSRAKIVAACALIWQLPG